MTKWIRVGDFKLNLSGMPALICLSLPAAAEEDASQNLDLHRIKGPRIGAGE